MKISNKNTTEEAHPFLPSGSWDGFFTYRDGPAASQHPMPSEFHFQDGDISGGGADAVGYFSWNGTYCKDGLICKMTKYYASHSVRYTGHIDENGIWGNWIINEFCSGGFHLWPKDFSEEMNREEEDKMAEGVKDNPKWKGLF